MSVGSKKFCVSDDARQRAGNGNFGAGYSAPVSSDVAEVAKRPKKRPGSRERSSITMGATRRPTVLV
jgi:hypothetical protein